MNSGWLYSVFVSVFALLSSASFAQDNFSKVQIQTEKLTSSTYMLTGAGGNLGVSIGADAVFVIDDQFAPLTPKIKAAIRKLSKKPVKFVLNTHWHFDHTGGNENFGRAGALIVAHDNVRKRMSTAQLIEFLGMPIKASTKQALPVVTFTSDVTFHLNGDEVHVFHVANGHTDGDAIVHFKKSNVIHLGDIFFNKLYPFIDTSSGGSVDGVIAATDKVLSLANDDTKLIPGHGPLATKGDLQSYRDMLATISARIKAQIKEGKKVEDAIAAKPTAEFDAVWGKGFLPPSKFVDMLWKNLQK
ncbi:MAG: MBL fold metallo-hydrolase [Betaproteobacteria bacterium]|nr:MBL fold metallo-hydrolase [Betaproteobacteria bacterium]